MRKLFGLLSLAIPFFSFSVAADDRPWAARQKLENITGFTLPKGWENQALWKTRFRVPQNELPRFYDWRFYANGLTPVKRQRAGDCWAQGTVGVLESLVKINLGIETDLSVQQVISCSGSGSAQRGGSFAHSYHQRVGAVSTEAYPYLARDTYCQWGLRPEYQLARWGYVGKRGRSPTVTEMKQALIEHGPLGVVIRANRALTNFTGNGVFTGCTPGPTNHIEVVVGWDDNEGEDGVWFVRNSWGPTHGKDGYAKIPYGCSSIGAVATWADLKMPPEE